MVKRFRTTDAQLNAAAIGLLVICHKIISQHVVTLSQPGPTSRLVTINKATEKHQKREEKEKRRREKERR